MVTRITSRYAGSSARAASTESGLVSSTGTNVTDSPASPPFPKPVTTMRGISTVSAPWNEDAGGAAGDAAAGANPIIITAASRTARNISGAIGVLVLLVMLVFPLALLAARASCGSSAEFFGTPVLFDVERPDPFGRQGRVQGAESVDVQRGLLLQISCFVPETPKPFRPSREEAIQAIFSHTRAMGVFGQDYYVSDRADRTYILATGMRNVNGQAYIVKIEHHLFARRSVTMLVSYRRGDEQAARRAQSFFDTARLAATGGP